MLLWSVRPSPLVAYFLYSELLYFWNDTGFDSFRHSACLLVSDLQSTVPGSSELAALSTGTYTEVRNVQCPSFHWGSLLCGESTPGIRRPSLTHRRIFWVRNSSFNARFLLVQSLPIFCSVYFALSCSYFCAYNYHLFPRPTLEHNSELSWTHWVDTVALEPGAVTYQEFKVYYFVVSSPT